MAIAAAPLLLAGCVPGPPVPAQAAGPTLVLDMTNQSDDEAIVSYEFEAAGTSGGGESLVAACRREAMPFSTISGDYSVLVDGEAVAEGAVPVGVGADAFFVIRVRVSPDGEVEAAPPVVLMEPPDVSAAIPCG